MSSAANIGPSTLRSNFENTSNYFRLLQTYANLLLTQMPLDLKVSSGLAFKINAYQQELGEKANTLHNNTIAEYIGIISKSINFCAIWDAAVKLDAQLLLNAAENPKAKANCVNIFHENSQQSGRLYQFTDALTDDLVVLNDRLEKISTEFFPALEAAIKDLGKAAEAESANIDALNKSIIQNINDISAGAEKAGAATTELVIGVLTKIADAKPDKDPKDGDGKKDPKEGNGKKDTTVGDGKKTPDTSSTDFVVSAIRGAVDGVAQTAQARADLNSNNEKLAAAYQRLANDNALIAVAKVIAAQNHMFISTMKEVQTHSTHLADTWGQPPISAAGSGISLEFVNFAKQIDAISTSDEAKQLEDSWQYESTNWDLLNKKLIYLKGQIVNF